MPPPCALSILSDAHFPRQSSRWRDPGPREHALEQLAAGLGMTDAVTFIGRLDNEAIAAVYDSADIMINPSLADNMPISVLEALASGVPVVSTNVGGIPYLVEHEKTAMLVPARNPEAMANAILSLLNDRFKGKGDVQGRY